MRAWAISYNLSWCQACSRNNCGANHKSSEKESNGKFYHTREKTGRFNNLEHKFTVRRSLIKGCLKSNVVIVLNCARSCTTLPPPRRSGLQRNLGTKKIKNDFIYPYSPHCYAARTFLDSIWLKSQPLIYNNGLNIFLNNIISKSERKKNYYYVHGITLMSGTETGLQLLIILDNEFVSITVIWLCWGRVPRCPQGWNLRHWGREERNRVLNHLDILGLGRARRGGSYPLP